MPPEKPRIANWNLPTRKSPIQELLERHNLGHIGQNLAQGGVPTVPPNGGGAPQIPSGAPPPAPGQFQSALGITPTTLQELFTISSF